MRVHREYLRRHAHRHHEAHLRLKKLLRHPPPKEKAAGVFVATFLVALGSLVFYGHWGLIRDSFTPPPPLPLPEVQGFKTGLVTTLKIEKQADGDYRNLLAGIPTFGGMVGVTTTHFLAQNPKREPPIDQIENLKKAIQSTTALGSGQHLTPFLQKKAQGLQKSVLATHYLGEKTADLTSTLGSDTQLLGQISNALSVDVFQVLNQAVSRSDSLDGYLQLLEALLKKTQERLKDLDYKINFLNGNLGAQETELQISEQTFFEHLKIFNGPNAEEALGKFIGLEQETSELKAKLGAYKSLRDYYGFFVPRLENLIQSIRLNRDALIAGVKVMEIEGMTLPLIIRQE